MRLARLSSGWFIYNLYSSVYMKPSWNQTVQVRSVTRATHKLQVCLNSGHLVMWMNFFLLEIGIYNFNLLSNISTKEYVSFQNLTQWPQTSGQTILRCPILSCLLSQIKSNQIKFTFQDGPDMYKPCHSRKLPHLHVWHTMKYPAAWCQLWLPGLSIILNRLQQASQCNSAKWQSI